jgi:putative transcriptional regulator
MKRRKRKMKNTVNLLLISKRMSKADLAEAIGVSRQTINNTVNERSPSLEVAIKIAQHFGKDVLDIFFIQDVKPVARKNKKSA